MEYIDLINRAGLYTLAIGVSTIIGYNSLAKAKFDILIEDFRSESMERRVESALDHREFMRDLEIDRKRLGEEIAKSLEEINAKLEKERAESLTKLRELKEAGLKELDAEKERLKQFEKSLENSLR